MKKIPTVKVYNADNFSVTHHHLSEPYVDREMDTEQVIDFIYGMLSHMSTLVLHIASLAALSSVLF